MGSMIVGGILMLIGVFSGAAIVQTNFNKILKYDDEDQSGDYFPGKD